jgi:hypothetical protein
VVMPETPASPAWVLPCRMYTSFAPPSDITRVKSEIQPAFPNNMTHISPCFLFDHGSEFRHHSCYLVYLLYLCLFPLIIVRLVRCVYNSFVPGWEDPLGCLTYSSSLVSWTLCPHSDTEGMLLTGLVQFIVHLHIVYLFCCSVFIAYDRA